MDSTQVQNFLPSVHDGPEYEVNSQSQRYVFDWKSSRHVPPFRQGNYASQRGAYSRQFELKY